MRAHETDGSAQNGGNRGLAIDVVGKTIEEFADESIALASYLRGRFVGYCVELDRVGDRAVLRDDGIETAYCLRSKA